MRVAISKLIIILLLLGTVGANAQFREHVNGPDVDEYFITNGNVCFSNQIQLSDTSCDIRLTIAQSFDQSGKDQETFLAYRLYIDSCYNHLDSWRAFHRMTVANIGRKPDTVGKNLEFREWLKKVLYYNTSEALYYCEDLRAIANSFAGWDRADPTDANAIVAMYQFIIDSTECDVIKESLKEGILEVRKNQYEIWADSVKDSLTTPFDTILPTIDDLGLGLIRKSQGSVLPSAPVVSIFEVSANPNPFSNELVIKYSLENSRIMTVEIHDVLGREIYRSPRQMHAAGKRHEIINTSNWEQGTYFARLATSEGEVKTIKLVLKR